MYLVSSSYVCVCMCASVCLCLFASVVVHTSSCNLFFSSSWRMNGCLGISCMTPQHWRSPDWWETACWNLEYFRPTTIAIIYHHHCSPLSPSEHSILFTTATTRLYIHQHHQQGIYNKPRQPPHTTITAILKAPIVIFFRIKYFKEDVLTHLSFNFVWLFYAFL